MGEAFNPWLRKCALIPRAWTRASLLDSLSKVAVCSVRILELYIRHSSNRSTNEHHFRVRDWGFLDAFVMFSLVSESFHLDNKSQREAVVRANCML